MKKLFFLLTVSGLVFFNACKDDDHVEALEYHVHIHSPAANSTVKTGDMLHVEVEFEEHAGGTVHNINIRIYNKATNAEVYNKPDDAHVHKTGSHIFKDDFAVGFAPGDYILEAKVWGHDNGVSETVEMQEFKVEL